MSQLLHPSFFHFQTPNSNSPSEMTCSSSAVQSPRCFPCQSPAAYCAGGRRETFFSPEFPGLCRSVFSQRHGAVPSSEPPGPGNPARTRRTDGSRMAERDPRMTRVSLLARVGRLYSPRAFAAGQAETHSARRRIPDIAGAVSHGLIVYLNIPLKDGFPSPFARENKLRRRGGAAERNSDDEWS